MDRKWIKFYIFIKSVCSKQCYEYSACEYSKCFIYCDKFSSTCKYGHILTLANVQKFHCQFCQFRIDIFEWNIFGELFWQIFLDVAADNVAALRLFESVGFIRDRRLPNYFHHKDDAFRLQLILEWCLVFLFKMLLVFWHFAMLLSSVLQVCRLHLFVCSQP